LETTANEIRSQIEETNKNFMKIENELFDSKIFSNSFEMLNETIQIVERGRNEQVEEDEQQNHNQNEMEIKIDQNKPTKMNISDLSEQRSEAGQTNSNNNLMNSNLSISSSIEHNEPIQIKQQPISAHDQNEQMKSNIENEPMMESAPIQSTIPFAPSFPSVSSVPSDRLYKSTSISELLKKVPIRVQPQPQPQPQPPPTSTQSSPSIPAAASNSSSIRRPAAAAVAPSIPCSIPTSSVPSALAARKQLKQNSTNQSNISQSNMFSSK
jgi:hypothetical protein